MAVEWLQFLGNGWQMPLILNERRIDGQGVKSKTVAEKQALVPRKQNFLISTPDGAQLPDVWKDSVFQGKHLPATPCSSAWRALGSNGHATLGLHLAGTLQNSKGRAMPVSGRLNTFNALDPFFHHLPTLTLPRVRERFHSLEQNLPPGCSSILELSRSLILCCVMKQQKGMILIGMKLLKFLKNLSSLDKVKN